MQREVLAFGEERRVVADELALHRARLGARYGVDLEEIEPAAQAVQQALSGVAGRLAFGGGDLLAQLRDALGVGDKALVGRLGRGERIVILRGAHEVRPEQLLLGRGDREIVPIQCLEVRLCIHHPARSASAALATMPCILAA